jgi:hypothetical protein
VESQIEKIQGDVDQITTRSLEDQLAQVKTQIQPLEQEVSTLQQEIAALEPTDNMRPPDVQDRRAQIALKKARIDQIQPLLTLYQEIYSNLVVLGKPVDSGSNGDARLARLQSTLDLYQNLYMNLLSSLETIRRRACRTRPTLCRSAGFGTASPHPPVSQTNTAGDQSHAGSQDHVQVEYGRLEDPRMQRAAASVLGFVLRSVPEKTANMHVSEFRASGGQAFRLLYEPRVRRRGTRRTPSATSPVQEGNLMQSISGIIALSGKTVVVVDADMRRRRYPPAGESPTQGLSGLFRSQIGRRRSPALWI